MKYRFLIAGVPAVSALPAEAIVPSPPPRVCTEFGDSKAVFAGDVLSERLQEITDENQDYAFSWQVRVLEQFKGRLPPIVTIHTSATSAREMLEVGRQHIIFAYQEEGRLHISGGGNIRTAPEIDPIIAEIRDHLAQPARQPTLAGEVVTWRPHRGGGVFLQKAGPMRLEFTNTEGLAVHGRADGSGHFMQVLTPGTWSVRVAEPGWSSERGDYSYTDIRGIELGPGGCADLQLLAAKEAPIGGSAAAAAGILKGAADQSANPAPMAAPEPTEASGLIALRFLALAAALSALATVGVYGWRRFGTARARK